VAYKLKKNWKAKIRLVTVVDNKEQEMQAADFMAKLIDLARLPKTETLVQIDKFDEFILKAPDADLNIFGLVDEPNFEFMEEMVDKTQTTCLFIRDSGMENILA
jgi:flagellar basal body rod protein FlgC